MRAVTVFLLVLSCILTGTVFQTSIGIAHSTTADSNGFVVPVQIHTYGPTWNGYLAFGLWQYNPSDLSPVGSYLVVMTTNGQLLYLRRSNDTTSYWPIKSVSSDTFMYMGEPDSLATHFWNVKTNKTVDFPNVWGHHDIEFNPQTGTFLTLRDYVREIDGHTVLMDKIVELDRTGAVLWSWDTYDDGHFSLKDECPCNDTTGGSGGYKPGQVMIDLTHSNTVQWLFDQNVVYFNMRALNTFCKINKTNRQTVWCLGEHGDFTLYDANGNKVPSLWYHGHDVHEVQPGIFLMFDNDYHNTTKPCQEGFNGTDSHSRMLEISVDEKSMTARTIWSWTAPSAYWTPYWGSVDILPNGDIIGAFGSQTHYVPNSRGAEIVEVNSKGEVVSNYTFPYGWGIYRITPIALQTLNDYDGELHTSDFSINLSTVNDLGGLANIYYRINNGQTESVNGDGQPFITTEGANSTLEYWSVDNMGIEEKPHRLLTGIKLEKSPPTILMSFPSNGSEIKSSSVTVTWTGSATSGIRGYQIRLDGRSFTSIGTNTTYTFNGLSDGTHTVDVKAIDNAGNQRILSVTFTVNTSFMAKASILAVVVIVGLGAGMYLLRSKKGPKQQGRT